MNTSLSYIFIKIDAIAAQLTFSVDKVGYATGNGLLFHQFFHRTQLTVSINERFLESGKIGSNAGGVIWVIAHLG